MKLDTNPNQKIYRDETDHVEVGKKRGKEIADNAVAVGQAFAATVTGSLTTPPKVTQAHDTPSEQAGITAKAFK